MDLKTHTTEFVEILTEIHPNLGWGVDEERKPYLIAIDGEMGSGKTHLANWLAWQFGAVALHLDSYWLKNYYSIEFIIKTELKSHIMDRLEYKRICILEGIYSLNVLRNLNIAPNYKIVIESDNSGENRHEKFKEYKNNNKDLFIFINKYLAAYGEK